MPTLTETPFNVRVTVRFTFRIGHPVRAVDLERAAAEAAAGLDAGLRYVSGDRAPGVHVFHGAEKVAEGGGVDQLWELGFVPPFLLTWPQVTAYHELAQNLVDRIDAAALGVIGLAWRIELGGVYQHRRLP